MNARSWLVPVLLAALPIAAADAALVNPPGSFPVQVSATAPGFNDVEYLTADTRSGVMLMSEFSAPTPSMDGHGVSVASVDTQLCRSGYHCGGLPPMQFAAVGARSPSKASGMTMLDLGLMMLFGVGLVVYQLERKQRLLRQSSLIAGSLD
jgi:hypothetical protein